MVNNRKIFSNNFLYKEYTKNKKNDDKKIYIREIQIDHPSHSKIFVYLKAVNILQIFQPRRNTKLIVRPNLQNNDKLLCSLELCILIDIAKHF